MQHYRDFVTVLKLLQIAGYIMAAIIALAGVVSGNLIGLAVGIPLVFSVYLSTQGLIAIIDLLGRIEHNTRTLSSQNLDQFLALMEKIDAHPAAAPATSSISNPAPSTQSPNPAFQLVLGSQSISLGVGQTLSPDLMPTLQPQPGHSCLAAVIANPQDPSQLGLHNLSLSTWTVPHPSGTAKAIKPGQVLRLLNGVLIQFSDTDQGSIVGQSKGGQPSSQSVGIG